MTSYILGGGITGLAAGLSSGLPVLEAAPEPGGICSSYYVKPGSDWHMHRVTTAPIVSSSAAVTGSLAAIQQFCIS